MRAAPPNPYAFSCLHCGRMRCAVCELLAVRIRRASTIQLAPLRDRQDRHNATYHPDEQGRRTERPEDAL
jgi:hypothetical protein